MAKTVRVTFLSMVVLAALGSPSSASPPNRTEEKFVVTSGTEHKVATIAGPGDEKVCLSIRDHNVGGPASGKIRTSTNGKSKDLGMSDNGGRCLSSHTGIYVVYVTAVGRDLDVLVSASDGINIGWTRKTGSIMPSRQKYNITNLDP